MTGAWRERWRSQPRRTRWLLAVYVIGFLEGTGAHVVDVAGGGLRAYASLAPLPLQVLFLSLVVLDPLVAVLVGAVRPSGLRLARCVMVLDVGANWIVDWPQLREDPAWLLRPVGLLPITLFGLFVIASSFPLLRSVRRTAPAHSCAAPLPAP